MKNRNFDEWLSHFRGSIANYNYYIDFDKVYRNIESIKIELNILNSLIGSKNIETDFEKIIKKYPETLKCIPLLVNVSYFKEMYIHQITEMWGIDLSAISNDGKMEKRFDFVIKTDNMIYGIETNFYASGGSKLNETARSYKQIVF